MSKNYLISIALAGFLVGCGGSGGDSSNKGADTNKPAQNQKSVKVVPSLMQNADLSDVGMKAVKATFDRNLNYDAQVQKVFVEDFKSPDAKDNYIWDMKYKNGKLAVASVYNNALIVFENDKPTLSKIANIKGAKHAKGEEATGVEGQRVDGTTGASENYFREVKFDSTGEYVYMIIRSKHLGGSLESQKYSDVKTRGIYKAKIEANNSIDEKKAIRADFSFSHFDVLDNGNIIGLDTNTFTFYILDKDLKKIKDFKVPNAFHFSAKKDKFFVYAKGESDKFIQEYDLDGNALGNKIPYPYAMDKYSFFELSDDAKKLFVLKDDTKDSGVSELCSYNTATLSPSCTNLSSNIVWSFVAFSPNGKQMALTKGFSNLTSIVNIEQEKPELVGQIDYDHDEHWFGITYMGDNKLAYSSDNRKIQVYSLSEGEEITKDTKFSWATSRAIADISQDINNIVISERKRHGKTSIKADLELPTFLHGVNISWTLSPEFSGYISEKGKAIKVPEKKISGKITANFKMLEDGKIYKEQNITKDISITSK